MNVPSTLNKEILDQWSNHSPYDTPRAKTKRLSGPLMMVRYYTCSYFLLFNPAEERIRLLKLSIIFQVKYILGILLKLLNN